MIKTLPSSTGIILISVCLISFRSLQADEVKETYDDGKPRIHYRTDAKDRRVGTYEEWHPNGRLRLHGQYNAGKKTGRWNSYDDTGKLRETKSYRDDLLEGPYLWTHPSGKPGVRGSYHLGQLSAPLTIFDEKGRLVRQITYPRSLASVKKAFASLYFTEKPAVDFATEPVTTPPYKAGALSPRCLDAAVKVTRLYRYLSGVPWEDLKIDPAMCDKSAHGAVLLNKIGSLTHTPERPDDMDDSFFQIAYAGCNKANLDMSGNPVDAVRNFMDDSDATNIEGLGHRQWVLSPGLKNVGFGSAGRFVSMYVADGNQQPRTDFNFIAFPGEGFYPLELIGAKFAWSVHINSRKANVGPIGRLKITLQKLDEHYQPAGDPVGAKVVSTPSPRFGWNTIVFKPDLAGLSASRYWVDITGVSSPGGQDMPFGYLVDLIEIKQAKPDLESGHL